MMIARGTLVYVLVSLFLTAECQIGDDPTNECDPSPCKHGTCIDGNQTYSCTCQLGFAGKKCCRNIDECASNPCVNGGTCKDGIGNFTCQCTAGYQGRMCETQKDLCASNPCKAGNCSSGSTDYTCTCPAGKGGKHCDLANCYNTASHTLYVGHYNLTLSGKACKRWDAISPYSIAGIPWAYWFPDDTLADAGNYCRDPSAVGSKGYLYCHLSDNEHETCGLSKCSN